MPGSNGREVEASEFNKGAAVIPRAPTLVVARVPKGDQACFTQISLRAPEGGLGQTGLAFQGLNRGPDPNQAAWPGPVRSGAGIEQNPDQEPCAVRQPEGISGGVQRLRSLSLGHAQRSISVLSSDLFG